MEHVSRGDGVSFYATIVSIAIRVAFWTIKRHDLHMITESEELGLILLPPSLGVLAGKMVEQTCPSLERFM